MAAMAQPAVSIDGFSGEPTPVLGGLLREKRVIDVVRPQLGAESPLVKAASTEDVLSVCERLANAQVSSMPVEDADGRCVGIVDFSDAVAFLLKMDWNNRGSLKDGHHVWDELGNVPISEAVDLSERNPKVEVPEDMTLEDAVKLFKEQRLRRALVVRDGTVIAVLSPSAVVQFLMKELKGRNDVIMCKSIAELGVGHAPVTSVKKTQAVLEAMHLMHTKRVSVVAVVDPSTGALAGSISMSDIKLVFQTKRFSMLVGSCWKYIVDERERQDTEVFPFFGVHDPETLQIVVSKLLTTSVHHMYVVNDKLQPQRVISFTDVCGVLSEHATVPASSSS